MERIKIRPANKRDAYPIMSLVNQLNPEAKSSESALPARVIQLERLLQDEAYHPIVAVVEREVVGYGLLVERYNLTHDGKSIALIEDVVVDEKHRGEGVGRKLLDELVSTARSLDVYKIQLTCEPDRISFYEQEGFSETDKAVMEIRIPNTNL